MNILILCTYPISNPKHGGQLRVRNIVDRYRFEGHNVEVVGVLGSLSYDPEDGFINFPGVAQLTTFIDNPFLMEDYAIGKFLIEDINANNRLRKCIKHEPDVIQIEHPWLFAFARRFLESNAPKARIVYSSHNVEWNLKREILSSYFESDIANKNSDLIKGVELDAINGADAIVCVSGEDAEWVRSQTEKPVVVAQNGVKAWTVTEAGRKEALAITQDFRYALYCASAHPPNMTGFFEMFADGFGSLKPDERLVIAGGAGWSIAGDLRIHKSAKLAEKTIAAGIVSQCCLEGLLDAAHCIILPITQGGGTNLKTAEALWSGKHIVATSVAMRGFERFIGVSGVHLADDPSSYKRALRLAMESEPLRLTTEEWTERRSVLWDGCLNPLIELIHTFAKKTHG